MIDEPMSYEEMRDCAEGFSDFEPELQAVPVAPRKPLVSSTDSRRETQNEFFEREVA